EGLRPAQLPQESRSGDDRTRYRGMQRPALRRKVVEQLALSGQRRQPVGDWQTFHWSSRYCRSRLRVERVCGSEARNVVALASACRPLTITWSTRAITGYCLAAATR